jgi:hypothetical protein
MPVDKNKLEEVYIQALEKNIISYLAKIKIINIRKSMEIYYNSNLCNQIHNGDYGIQYLDYKNLVLDLIENEPYLFIK